jgi:hypothetical protein
MIPMHYNTFRLSNEPMEEPLERLSAAARLAGLAGQVMALGEGHSWFASKPAHNIRAFPVETATNGLGMRRPEGPASLAKTGT